MISSTVAASGGATVVVVSGVVVVVSGVVVVVSGVVVVVSGVVVVVSGVVVVVSGVVVVVDSTFMSPLKIGQVAKSPGTNLTPLKLYAAVRGSVTGSVEVLTKIVMFDFTPPRLSTHS
jgi:hypothetical protein